MLVADQVVARDPVRAFLAEGDKFLGDLDRSRPLVADDGSRAECWSLLPPLWFAGNLNVGHGIPIENSHCEAKEKDYSLHVPLCLLLGAQLPCELREQCHVPNHIVHDGLKTEAMGL